MNFSTNFLKLEKTSLQIIVILVIVLILRLSLEIIVKRVLSKQFKSTLTRKARLNRRIKTILTVLNNLAITVALVICTLLILGNFFNLTGVLASAGILGIGISLGAQSIFKDFITGFFFLSQDQFGAGDTVQIGPPFNLVGKITNITLRTITIRDLAGNITTIPNSMINQITNQTKGWSVADILFNFQIATEIEKVYKLLEKANENITSMKELKSSLVDAPEILGIEGLDGKISIRVQIKTQPGRQYEIARKYRYIVKKLTEEEAVTLA